MEFDPALRFIDVANDLAFLSMDLAAHGRRDLRLAPRQPLAACQRGNAKGTQIWLAATALLEGLQAADPDEVVRSGGDDLLAADPPTRRTVVCLLALFGFIGTGNVMNLVKNKVLSDARIALLAPFTGAIDLREPPNPNIFHIRASYTDEAAKMVEHLHSIGVRRFAVMYQNDGFGKSGLAGAESALGKLGLKAVATGSYDRTKPEEVDEAAGV